MATFDTNRTMNDGVHFGAGISGFITALISKLHVWNDRRLTRNALSTLTSRELDDIGLSRGDIANM